MDSSSDELALAKDPRTLTPDSRRRAPDRTGTLWAGRLVAGERQQLSAGMTTTLSAELEGRVARDLVADIVRAVVDESRHTAQERTVESLLAEARQRLERFIRARSSR